MNHLSDCSVEFKHLWLPKQMAILIPLQYQLTSTVILVRIVKSYEDRSFDFKWTRSLMISTKTYANTTVSLTLVNLEILTVNLCISRYPAGNVLQPKHELHHHHLQGFYSSLILQVKTTKVNLFPPSIFSLLHPPPVPFHSLSGHNCNYLAGQQ